MPFATAASQKSNLKRMKNLSREEMKKVMGGFAPGGGSCGCAADTDCGYNHYCSSSQVITCDDKTTGKACVRN